MLTIFSLSLIAGGSLYVARSLSTQPVHAVYEPSRVNQGAAAPMELGYPINLSLPRLGKELSIKEGYYDPTTQQWTLDDSHVFYMQGSATPIFYGHNQNRLLDKLDELHPGDRLLIKNDEGATLQFTYMSAKTVAPDDTWLLNEKHNNTVMVLSCTGFFLESRQVFYFEYVGVSS